MVIGAGIGSAEPGTNPMTVGVDDAGSTKAIYDDPAAQDAFEQIGFDFLMYHFWGAATVDHVERLDQWAKRFKKVENATAVIWKLLLIAERRFRRLNAPDLLVEVWNGVEFMNGRRVPDHQERAAA
jgi:hypothetical protein